MYIKSSTFSFNRCALFVTNYIFNLTQTRLEPYEKHLDKKYKTERDNWILFRGLRREIELVNMIKKPC